MEAERLQREEDARHEEIERRRQEAEKQELRELERQRQELIQWLKPFDYNSKHQASTQLRQEGTCGWLLEDPTFKDWRSESGSKFLWLFGIRMYFIAPRISALIIAHSWQRKNNIIVRIH